MRVTRNPFLSFSDINNAIKKKDIYIYIIKQSKDCTPKRKFDFVL